MKSTKHVVAALLTVCLLTLSLLSTEAAETGNLKKAGANSFANGSPSSAVFLAGGTSKTESAKKTGSDNSAEKEKEKTGKETGKETKKETRKETKKETGKETKKETKKETGKETKKETGKETKKETGKETKKETGKETKKETGKETKKETEKKTEEKTEKKTGEKNTEKKAEVKENVPAAIEKAKNNALNALSNRLSWTRGCVYVYRDYGLTKNHFTQRSKTYGSDKSRVKDMDENCGKKPYSGTSCIRCEQTGNKKDRGGWMFLNGYLKKWDGTPKPNDGKKGGAGLDLTGAEALRFYARGKKGGEVVEFFACGFGYDKNNKKTTNNPDSSTRKSTGQVKLTKEWKEYAIPLKGADLSYVVCGFGYEVSGKENGKKDTVFYLDEIRFTGKIQSAQTAPVLLRSSDSDDKKLKNTAYTEDNALAALAFLSEGKKKEAKEILDAFVYAIQNDRAYDSDEEKNGPRRVRNAYSSGDISAFPGWNSGTRLSGWYEEDSGKWVEDQHQVGSSTGSNSFAALALVQYYNTYGGETYLETARSLMDWVLKKCFDHSLGYTEGFDGWKESDKLDDYPLDNKPTKDNIIAYAAFSRLYEATAEEKYLEAAESAIRFIEMMYNERKGRFITGTLDEPLEEPQYVTTYGTWYGDLDGTLEETEEDNFIPDKRIVALNVQSLSALAMWDSFGPYLKTLDTIEAMKVKKGGYPYNRNNKNGGWWAEGTAFTALMYRVFGKEDKYEEAMNALVKIQNNNGLFPAATVKDFYTGVKLSDGSSLKYTKDTHIAPSAWFIMAANGYNPFVSHGTKKSGKTKAAASADLP